jgi:hypothetical protein
MKITLGWLIFSTTCLPRARAKFTSSNYQYSIAGSDCVSRFTGKSNESFEAFDQVQIIKKCLTKHHTSDRSLHRESKGLGLNRILNLLDKKGLIMIRTAGVFLFRNLKRYPHVESQEAENMELYDWQTNSSDNYSEMSSATGSVVSIVYPIAINL